MKILIICKKHWKLVNSMFKTSTIHPYEENPMFPGFGGDLYGLNFKVYIKPYLKKPRIIDETKFNFILKKPKLISDVRETA